MKNIFSTTVLLFAILLTTPTVSAQIAVPAKSAQQVADATARLESVLRAFEATPNRAQLEAGFPDAASLLIEAANDTERDLFTRLRATSLLSNFETAESRDALIGLTQNPQFEMRRMAYYILGRTFGNSPEFTADNTLLATIERGTRDEHADVRAHTVRSLRWIKSPAADKLLESIAQSSPDQALRELAQQTLARKTPANPTK